MSEHRVLGGIEHKRCSRCAEWKPLLHFSGDRTAVDELDSACRPCHAESQGPRNHAVSVSRRRAQFDKIRRWARVTSPLHLADI